MCLGLTFIGCAYTVSARSRWESEKRRMRLNEVGGKRLSLGVKVPVTDEERKVLADIRRQVADSERPTSANVCPECDRQFIIIVVQGVALEYCRICRSTWFDPGELSIFSGLSKDVPSDDLTHRASNLSCPVCRKRMDEYVYLSPYNLLVDQCNDGHGVYLQDREIERVFEIN